MGVTFNIREIAAKEFEQELFTELSNMGFVVAINGTEHTHPNFVRRLHFSNDTTSLFLRYQPDGVAAIGDPPLSFFVEAKNSRTIEKNAYIQYTNLVKLGNIVVVVFKPFRMKWCFVEHMPLIHGNDTTARFTKEKRFPVDSDGWICPRSANRKPMFGSGTPYREIRSSELHDLSELKQSIVSRST